MYSKGKENTHTKKRRKRGESDSQGNKILNKETEKKIRKKIVI